jgi:hypothetical protein
MEVSIDHDGRTYTAAYQLDTETELVHVFTALGHKSARATRVGQSLIAEPMARMLLGELIRAPISVACIS